MNLQGLTPHAVLSIRYFDPFASPLHFEIVCAHLRQVFINGNEFSVLERGKGEPVLFVHGPLADYRAWHKQLEFLSGRYRVISYSRRAHYPNSILNNPAEYQPATHVADLATLIENLEAVPVHLIGRSDGGAIAALLTNQRPDLVRSLTLAEPRIFSVLTGPNDKVALGFLRIAFDVVRKMAETGEMNMALGEYIRLVYGKDMLAQLPEWVQVMFAQNSHTLPAALTTYFETAGFNCAAARRIRCPVLIINGELSPTLNLAIGGELNAIIPNSRLWTLPRCSYGMQLDHPADFNEAISTFLAGLDLESPN